MIVSPDILEGLPAIRLFPLPGRTVHTTVNPLPSLEILDQRRFN